MTDPVEDFINSVAAKELGAEEAFGTEFGGGQRVPPEVLGKAAEVAVQMPDRCPEGHETHGSTKFCPECGMNLLGLPVSSRLGVEMAARAEAYRPKPEGLLTDAERAERNRQHQAAVAAGKRDAAPVFDPPPEGVATFLIHFVEDGFTGFGVIWYRGQELEVAVGSPRWHEGWETGVKWLQWQDAEQMARCGKVYFRRGPWPGQRSYADGAGGFEKLAALGGAGQVTGPSVESLLQADKLEARRRRGVPRPTRV